MVHMDSLDGFVYSGLPRQGVSMLSIQYQSSLPECFL